MLDSSLRRATLATLVALAVGTSAECASTHRIETDLNEADPGDPRGTTTPEAFAEAEEVAVDALR